MTGARLPESNGTKPKSCACFMFNTRGTCYHTGYRPTFRDQRPPEPKVPEAIRRMHAWLALPEVQAAERRRAKQA